MKESTVQGPRLVTSAFKATRAVMQQSAKSRKAYSAAATAAAPSSGPRPSHNNIVSLHVQRMESFDDDSGTAVSEQCIDYLLDAGPILRKYVEASVTAPTPVRTMSFGAPLGQLQSPSAELKKLVDEFQMKALKAEVAPTVTTIEVTATFKEGSCVECTGLLMQADGHMVCTGCGLIPPDSAREQQMSYKDAQEMLFKANGSYKRSARWSEWLSSMQAKENTDIPDSVLRAILKEIERERIDIDKVEPSTIKDCLRKLGLTRYYHHSPRILKYINGRTPISIPSDVENNLIIMFDYIQEAYEAARAKLAPDRQAFLNYPFVLYKCLELLGCKDLVKHFPLLKNREKMMVQDDIWRAMMAIVGWKFVPTL